MAIDSDFYDVNLRIPYANKNYLKIVDFYLFNCPARYTHKQGKENNNCIYTHSKVSVRGKTFEDHGFRGGGLLALRAAMKRASYKGHLGTVHK